MTLFFLFRCLFHLITAYFRRKCVTITDDRVQKMNEVLTYIKFIKMYAWSKHSQSVQSEFKTWCMYIGFCFLSTLATGNPNVVGSEYHMFL